MLSRTVLDFLLAWVALLGLAATGSSSRAEGVANRFRNSMSRCVRWTELWPGAGQATSRAEILAALKAYEFHRLLR